MDFLDEMNHAKGLDLTHFEAFIKNQMNEKKDYLEQPYGLPDGSQITVLNYLIDQYHEPENGNKLSEYSTNIVNKIDVVLALAHNANAGEPLHQAILTNKIHLALHLLQAYKIISGLFKEMVAANVINILSAFRKKTTELTENVNAFLFDVNQRDRAGRTLLSLAINTKNTELLIGLLAKNPHIHATTVLSNANVEFPALHQCIALNYDDGVRLLAHEKANLSNTMGVMKDTPLLLAARLGKIRALEALVEFSVEELKLDAVNNRSHTAIEELCERIAKNDDKAEAIRGVAILLCRGAEPPRNGEMRAVLRRHRGDLLKFVHLYLEDKPELVDAFVQQCHLSASALHNIIYADHSWGSSIRHLLGTPSSLAFSVEDLVIRKYSNTLVATDNGEPIPITATANLASENNSLKLYAEFVRRYKHAYENQLLPNRWSTMRWMIAEGRCDWPTVERYAAANPKSRTAIILQEMCKSIPSIHEDIDVPQDSTPIRGM